MRNRWTSGGAAPDRRPGPVVRWAACLTTRLACVRADHERGASAVEYGLLAAGVVGAFVAGTAGFNGALGAIFQRALDAIPATTP